MNKPTPQSEFTTPNVAAGPLPRRNCIAKALTYTQRRN